MRVVVIDDAATFRTQIKSVLQDLEGVEVVGVASNGKIGLEICQQTNPDLITLDLNMPVMGGLDFLKEIKALKMQSEVIVFAAKSARSAKDTIEALGNGALDFVVKPQGNTYSLESAIDQIRQQLLPKISMLLKKTAMVIEPQQMVCGSDVVQSNQASAAMNVDYSSPIPMIAEVPRGVKPIATFKPKAIVIASSTGGPGALETFLGEIDNSPSVPIFIAQHMPETFTKFLASRLATVTNSECREAEHNEVVKPGMIYMAPGNFHMSLKYLNGEVRINIDQETKIHNVRPAADVLFNSAADIYQENLAGFILTGMGSDGARGAQKIRAKGGRICLQDEESAIVWGMPGAAHALGAYDKVASLIECGHIISRMVRW